MTGLTQRIALLPGLALGLLLLAGCEPPTAESTQNGYRGTGMLQLQQPDRAAELMALNVAPAPEPPAPDIPGLPSNWENVEVLNGLNTLEMNRIMTAMSKWVGEENNCNYCHVAGNFAADDKYQKVVSRRMLQMTQHINSTWTDHVAETGVTCYTCHRGNNVPENIWWQDPGPETVAQFSGNRKGQNAPGKVASAYSTLPYDPFSPYLVDDTNIRLQSTVALPGDHEASIASTEGTYALMMHMSDSLGVNCTFCHNTRAFGEWEQSTPQRVTSWYGIRMARDLNNSFLNPLQGVYPEHRLGPLGDAPKANCATCHQGVNKPLMGAQMVKDYPSLQQASGEQMSATPASAAATTAQAAGEVMASDSAGGG
ncbi:MAG TPA: photosynthetic reaction center cytochrome PufC [Pseudomonadales bacterium]|nr:photosynthetic reaction center cytochrome PufC [Pseudomonadales bacterium]